MDDLQSQAFHQPAEEPPPPEQQEEYRREYELQMQRMACYGCGEC